MPQPLQARVKDGRLGLRQAHRSAEGGESESQTETPTPERARTIRCRPGRRMRPRLVAAGVMALLVVSASCSPASKKTDAEGPLRDTTSRPAKAPALDPVARQPSPTSVAGSTDWRHPGHIGRLLVSPDGTVVVTCSDGAYPLLGVGVLAGMDAHTGAQLWLVRDTVCSGAIAVTDDLVVAEREVGVSSERLAVDLRRGTPVHGAAVVAWGRPRPAPLVDGRKVVVSTPGGPRTLAAKRPVVAAAQSDDATWAAAALDNGCVKLWKAPGWIQVPVPCRFDEEDDALTFDVALAFSSAPPRLYFSEGGGHVRVFELGAKQLLRGPAHVLRGYIHEVQVSPSGRVVTIRDFDAAARWSPPSPPTPLSQWWPTAAPVPLDDDHLFGLVKGNGDENWLPALGTASNPAVVGGARPTDNVFGSADGSRALALRGTDVAIFTRQGVLVRSSSLQRPFNYAPKASPALDKLAGPVLNPQRGASAGDELRPARRVNTGTGQDLVVVDTATGEVLWSRAEERHANVFGFSPDGTRLLVSDADPDEWDIRVLSALDGAVLGRVPDFGAPSKKVEDAAWLTARQFVLGLRSGDVCFYPPGTCVYAHPGGVVDVAVAADGTLVTAGLIRALSWK
jgi:hypothetical protein